MQGDFYSDRVYGAAPRDRDVLPEVTTHGLLTLVRARTDGNWLAAEFPEHCRDGNGICGTALHVVYASINGLIPRLNWPAVGIPDQADLFDLIEFVGVRIAKPSDGPYHEFWKHHELNFDTLVGREAFARDVNQLLYRGCTMFEMDPATMQIQRIGTPEVRRVVADLMPASGDETLDGLLTDARLEYASRDHKSRVGALQKIWDAFERLKTLDAGANKKTQTAALLATFEPEAWRATVEAEMRALTNIGNTFHIRHFETNTIPVPNEAEDYLFTRIGALVVLILRHTGRLAG
jgi:hypothetical protein